MQREVNVQEAKTHLSRLLVDVERGDEVIIGRAGRPVARLVPYRKPVARRVPGAWRGRVVIADDFDELPEEMAAALVGNQP